ncbi:hypothetical protein ADK60_38125 [Streptomyces sp. XY431]|uniref:hypothetical protein n=1 Tax=Streptomyces sp. XY431 TaxID=1415562 RepID=UPI0006AFA6B4|nr:hypothetical protein [Streptomyces sp. XY431]KOV10356.1 hypothetical protein ADK60_38125 [Streptomyces sp. XY431]
MRIRTLLATLALAATAVPAVALGAGTAQAAPLLCGTLPADYIGHTYFVVTQGRANNPGFSATFDSDGTLRSRGLVAGRWSSSVAQLSVSALLADAVSTFRGCDGSLTTPGFVSLLGKDLQSGDTLVLTLTLVS